MKTSLFAKLVAVAHAGVLASCSPPSPVASPTRSDPSLSGKLFDEVNSYRVSKGKSVLQRHSGLDRLAQQHCDHLAKTQGQYDLYGKKISHIGFEGRAMAARHSHRINSVGENVVISRSHSPKHLVNIWKNSETHEHNMRADWDCAGIATAVTPDGSVISTQIFGTSPSMSGMDLKKRFSRH